MHPGILKQHYSCTRKVDIAPQKLTLHALAYNKNYNTLLNVNIIIAALCNSLGFKMSGHKKNQCCIEIIQKKLQAYLPFN